ncbi:hypothetical protein BGZ52_002556 [Haplosporangium bisporale]|nr:hypothetical protein BGZ52_002556 [Haplosporangium bisporale]
MLSQRFNSTSTERWTERDERDSSYNIMSPVGRKRHFKGLSLPSKKISMVWDHPMSITNTISGNSHNRDESTQAWEVSEGFHASAPQDIEGVSYVYHKGPAGQTPFPTLIAMTGYFPSTQHSTIPQPQAQMPSHHNHSHIQHHPHQHQGFQPYPKPSPPRNAFHAHYQQHPSQVPSKQQLSQKSHHRKRPSTTNAKKEQGDDTFWSRAYPMPETQPQPLTREQVQMWHYHHDQIQPFIF